MPSTAESAVANLPALSLAARPRFDSRYSSIEAIVSRSSSGATMGSFVGMPQPPHQAGYTAVAVIAISALSETSLVVCRRVFR